MATLLEMCQDIADDLSIDRPVSVVANTDDPDAMLLLTIARMEGRSLSWRAHWDVLIREQTFTTTAAAVQANAIPSDFSRIIPETVFNRTQRRELYGPVGAQEWQQIQAGLIIAIDPCYRRRAGDLLISPTPAAGETIAFEYITTHWCEDATGTGQTTFAADSDVPRLDSEIFKAGMIWRWRKRKGLPFEDERLDYERMVVEAILNDGGKPRLNTGHIGGQIVKARGRAQMNDFNTIG